MTYSQQKIYDTIKEYIETYNEAPSIREICLIAGLNSQSTTSSGISSPNLSLILDTSS